ncbi:MAG: Fe-S cluster assembly protein NifU [Armatimonadota bacterium]
MWEYTDKVKDHFLNPRNVGEIEDPDGVGEVGNLRCGDALRLTIRVDDDERISDIKFQTFGCASAIASASAMTELAEGMHIDEAAKLTNDDIAQYLGGLPAAKMHCSVMGAEALHKAVADYRGETIEDEDEEKLVCECFKVTEAEIRRAVTANNLNTVEEVTNYTKAGGGCGECVPVIQELINQIREECDLDGEPEADTDRATRIRRVLDDTLAGQLGVDAGDLQLMELNNDRAVIGLREGSALCEQNADTVRRVIAQGLRTALDEEVEVEVTADG